MLDKKACLILLHRAFFVLPLQLAHCVKLFNSPSRAQTETYSERNSRGFTSTCDLCACLAMFTAGFLTLGKGVTFIRNVYYQSWESGDLRT